MAGDVGGDGYRAAKEAQQVDVQRRARAFGHRAFHRQLGGDRILGAEILHPVHVQPGIRQVDHAILMQMGVVDFEGHRAVGQARLAAQGYGEIAHRRLHRDADIVHRQVRQHRHLEHQVGADLAAGGFGIDAELGGIAQRLHVDQRHHVGHGAFDTHAELSDRSHLMQVGDQDSAVLCGQRPDAPGREIGLEGVAGHDGVALYIGGARQALDVIALHVLHGKGQLQRIFRQYVLIQHPGREVGRRFQRPHRA